MTRAEEKAIDAWAIYEYREHPKGLYHTCFVDGYKEGYDQGTKDIQEYLNKWISEKISERGGLDGVTPISKASETILLGGFLGMIDKFMNNE